MHRLTVQKKQRAARAGLVDRESLVEVVALAAVAGEHVLVVGPPGTAKSEAVRRIAAQLGGRYFEYLLGRFTELTVDPRAIDGGLASAGSSRQAQSFTVAANWYPNPYVKFYGTFERTVFDHNAGGPRHAENAILVRTQLGF